MTMSHSAMSCRRRPLDDWLALSGQMITGFNTLSTIIFRDLVSQLPLIIFSLFTQVGFFVISLLVNKGACVCVQEQWAVLSQFHYSGYLFWNHLLHLSGLCLEDIFWIAQCFAVKHSMVVHRHEPEYHAKKLGCCLQGQGHSEGLYDQNMTFGLYFLNWWLFWNQT